jgi:hypothetical protein
VPKTKVLVQSNWAEKLARAYEVCKIVQPALDLIPANLASNLTFQAPVWENFAESQRIFNRLDQFARLPEFFNLPTEEELEARYEEQKKANEEKFFEGGLVAQPRLAIPRHATGPNRNSFSRRYVAR